MDAPLYNQLRVSLAELDAQIRTISEEAKEHEIEPMRLKYMDGRYVLAPLLAARANVLSTMGSMKAADSNMLTNNKRGRTW